VNSFLDSWSLTYGNPEEENVRLYESAGNLLNRLEESAQPFIPYKVHFATNFNGGLRFFDSTRPRPRGEMEVVCWSTNGGTIERHSSFVAMLRADLRRLKAAVGPGSAGRTPRG
jgi:hypothetical protein